MKSSANNTSVFLHIGNGKSLRTRDVVGIFDLDTATVSKVSKKFLSRLSGEGKVAYTDDDLPRSFILVSDKEKNESVSLSRISVQGLRLRAGTLPDESDI